MSRKAQKKVKKIEKGEVVPLKDAEAGEEVPVAVEGVAEQEEPILEIPETKEQFEKMRDIVSKTEAEKPIERPSDMVKVKVVFGSVMVDGKSYEVGDMFTVSRERAETIDKRFIQIED